MSADRTCRVCGCTNLRACPGGCSWVLLDIETPTGICTTCAKELEWRLWGDDEDEIIDLAQELVA